jgi:hypothetical protein
MQEIQENKKKGLSKTDAFNLLDKNLDYILKKISENVSYATLAKEFNVNVAYLCFFLNQDEIKEKKEVALQIASYKMIDEAKQYLESIEADDTNASVRKKCELSQFSTYLAKVKNRKEFDLNYKEQQDTATSQQIVVIPANFSKNIDNQNQNNNNNLIEQ